MTSPVSTEIIWQALEKELFAVLGMVNQDNKSRTVGIVYVIKDRKLYIGTGISTWKARHIKANPFVSMTVPIPKQIPFLPWIKIPPATVTFSGKATVIPADQVDPDLLRHVFRHVADDEEMMKTSCIIEIHPEGEFVTFGVGIPLMRMRNPNKARGRAPVSIDTGKE